MAGPATLDTSTMAIATNASMWTATLAWNTAGAVGNGKRLHVAIGSFAGDPGGALVEVRDNQKWDGAAWIAEAGTVGVAGDRDVNTDITTGDVETAINAASALCQVTTADPSDEDITDATGEWEGTFAGGADPGLVTVDGYARMMMALLPPGRVWRLFSSVLEKLFLACAEELARLDERVIKLLDEADPSTADELLPEYERELDIEAVGTNEQRQAHVLARHIAEQGFRPEDLKATLAPLLGLEPEDVVVLERTHAISAAMGDDREIYRFFVYRNPALPGTYFLASAQDLLDDILHSHTDGYVIESIDASHDDDWSHHDADLMGA